MIKMRGNEREGRQSDRGEKVSWIMELQGEKNV